MKAKKLFPDLSFKRLWDKIKELENKVGDSSDINLDELNKKLSNKLGFIDMANVIKPSTTVKTGDSYTATEDCYIMIGLYAYQGTTAAVTLNGVSLCVLYSQNGTTAHICPYPIKKGDVIVFTSVTFEAAYYEVYGIR